LIDRPASRIEFRERRFQPLSHGIVFGGELNHSVHDIDGLAQLRCAGPAFSPR
jgi:hypothetical protein